MKKNKKIIVLYYCHFINDFSLSQYYKLKNELPEGYDICWFLDNSCKDHRIEGINYVEFPHECLRSKPLTNVYYYNVTKYVEQFFVNNEVFRKYDYYWIVEYDIYFSGNWSIFFNTIDKYDEDLVGTTFNIYKQNGYMHSFVFGNNFDEFKTKIKSFIPIYRISNRALNYISNYNKDKELDEYEDITKYLYEIYIPTLLHDVGYTILSLNSEKDTDIPNNENHLFRFDLNTDFIHYYDDTGFIDNAMQTFWWNKTFYNKKEMNVKNKLYHRFKPL